MGAAGAGVRVSARTDAMRRALFLLVGSVVALDAVVLALYVGLGIASKPSEWRTGFVVVWIVATGVVVGFGMKRLREARRMR